MRNYDKDRIEDAARSIEEAMVALARAVCLLGFTEGKEAVQIAHGVVRDTHQYVQNQNEVAPWRG